MKFKKITSGKSYGIMYDTRYTFKNKVVNDVPEIPECSVTIDDIQISGTNLIIDVSYENIDALSLVITGTPLYDTGLKTPTSQFVINNIDYDLDAFTGIGLYGYVDDVECVNHELLVTSVDDTMFNVSATYDLTSPINYFNSCTTADTKTYSILSLYSGTTCTATTDTIIDAYDEDNIGGFLALLYCSGIPSELLRITYGDVVGPTGNMLSFDNINMSCKSGTRKVNAVISLNYDTITSGTTFTVNWTGDDGYTPLNNVSLETLDKITYTTLLTITGPNKYIFTIETPDVGCTVTGDITFALVSSSNIDITNLPLTGAISF